MFLKRSIKISKIRKTNRTKTKFEPKISKIRKTNLTKIIFELNPSVIQLNLKSSNHRIRLDQLIKLKAWRSMLGFKSKPQLCWTKKRRLERTSMRLKKNFVGRKNEGLNGFFFEPNGFQCEWANIFFNFEFICQIINCLGVWVKIK